MIRRWQGGIAIVGALLGAMMAGGCASSHGAEKLDDSRLAGIPQDQMQPVVVARHEVSQTRLDEDAAKQEKSEADNRVVLAKSEQDVAQSHFDELKTKGELQLKNQQEQAQAELEGKGPLPAGQMVLVSPEEMRQGKLALDTSKAKVDYLKKMDDVADTNVKVQGKRGKLAEAKLDKARFDVLNEANPDEVKAMKLNQAEFESKVLDRQSDLAGVKVDLARNEQDAREAYQKWAGLDRQLAQQTPAAVRRAEVPPPPKG